MKGKTKHPHTYKCGLCGKAYAVPNSTFRVSQTYRQHFCKDCTVIIQTMIRKMKLVMHGLK